MLVGLPTSAPSRGCSASRKTRRGTPFTSVPEFFTGWVSWFNGDATDLFPTEPLGSVQLKGLTRKINIHRVAIEEMTDPGPDE